ncbi:hypothetical protein [Streptomyces rubellomurinus]|uniref:Protein kinase domain-containing protein n=1 Tax=Streptomyces rubellomurinus (strain ATCC 31215) TaxID=359131 RepID=A0A0F2THT7_STRR3|nr:hypothetical protein [Streptomyces rubellomurinus]KJS61840.1 hypothetical protein VM95_12665 [Streptomyces rubellomurinus]
MRQLFLDHAERVAAHAGVATRLALLSDRRLAELVAAAAPAGSGVGGRCAELEVDGTPVFVKRVPLTDLELHPEHVRSTANLFGLPMFYQYGLGSAGFGAWRELAVHAMTTHWVLARAYEGFPLTHHWRVLPDTPPEDFADEFGGVDGAVAHWDGSPAVRARLEAIGRSTHSLVLFLEHVPHTLGAWLYEHREAVAPDGRGTVSTWAADELARGAAFMRAHGLVHFDAHLRNLLTDGRRIHFADFGLALSADFELTRDERRFLADHLGYDHHHTASHLIRHHLLDRLPPGTDPDGLLRAWAAGRGPAGVPSDLAAILDRHARSALVLDEFHRRLLTGTKRVPYPAATLSLSPSDVEEVTPR